MRFVFGSFHRFDSKTIYQAINQIHMSMWMKATAKIKTDIPNKKQKK